MFFGFTGNRFLAQFADLLFESHRIFTEVGTATVSEARQSRTTVNPSKQVGGSLDVVSLGMELLVLARKHPLNGATVEFCKEVVPTEQQQAGTKSASEGSPLSSPKHTQDEQYPFSLHCLRMPVRCNSWLERLCGTGEHTSAASGETYH